MDVPKYAIIGLGLRLPGHTNTPEMYFNNLKNGVDSVEEIPKNRWNKDFFFHPDSAHPGTMVTKRCGFVEPFYEFDNESFKMSIRESKSIDPTAKVLLEVALETFQDSNVKYEGTNTGVFIGCGHHGFTRYSTTNPNYCTEYSATGTNAGIVSNIISYKFDLRGPSFIQDSACSSTGNALYAAVLSLRGGFCDMALVGGFNTLINHIMTVCYSRLGVLAPDGKCKCFDKNANGYVRSEGAGLVLIKPLKKAIEDNDHIYSVIRGVCANVDGALEPSLTKPSTVAQELLLKTALKDAKVSPEEVFYVEAHSTGTQVGDPAECLSIGRLCGRRDSSDKVRIGAVKRNIGHTEFASHMSGLIKVCLMMEKKKLLPTIVEEFSPKIKGIMDQYNLTVQQKVEKFDPHGKVFIVNSFGFGGANACTIVEGFCKEKPVYDIKERIPSPYLYTVGARTERVLEARIKQIKEFSENLKDQHQLSYNLNTRIREGDKFISFSVGNNCHESNFLPPIRISKKKHICFVLSGQGPQNVKMGKDLYKSIPIFKEIIDKCDKIYKELSDISVINDIGLFGSAKEANEKELSKVENTLPSLMFMQIALFNLWKSFGVNPDVILAHSFGEMCALYANGSITMRKALEITYARGQICKKLDNQGRMIAIGCSLKEIEEIIKERKLEKIWICADNAPKTCTVGGAHESVEKLDKICEELKIFHRILSITNAFHTPLLHPLKSVADKLFPNLDESNPPSVRFLSTVTTEFWDAPFSKDYLWENISQPVYFKGAIEKILTNYESIVFLEISPQPVLSLSMKQCGAENVLFSLQKNVNEQSTILQTCAKLEGYGFKLNWDKIMGRNERLWNLPRYPFQRNDCFLKIPEMDRHRFVLDKSPDGSILPGPLIGRKQDCSKEVWVNYVNTKKYLWLADHVVQNTIVYPAAAYVEQFMETSGTYLQNVTIHSPVVVPSEGLIYKILETKVEGNNLIISSKQPGVNDKWVLNATCERRKSIEGVEKYKVEPFESYLERCKDKTVKKEIYQKLQLMDLNYGPYFQLLESVQLGDGEGFGVIDTTVLNDLGYTDRYIIHPAIIDNLLQLLLYTNKQIKKYLPTFFKSFYVYSVKGKLPDKIYAYCEILEKSDNKLVGSIHVFDKQGELIMDLIGCENTAVREVEDCENKRSNYKVIYMKKELPDVNFKEIISSKTSKEWETVNKNLPKLYERIIRVLQPSLKRLKGLSIPKEKHKYLSYINKYSEEIPKSDQKLTVDDLSDIPNFETELLLVKNIVKHFAMIMRKKKNTKEKERNELIKKYLENSVSFKKIVEYLLLIVTQIISFPNRVVRILEITSKFRSLSSIILPALKGIEKRVELILYKGEDLDMKINLEEYPFVKYLDVDPKKSFRDMGLLNNSIDMIFGVDVDYSKIELSDIRRVLVKNGIIFFVHPNEQTQFFSNFIFGSIDEYWKQPKDKRTQNSNTFNKYLEENGFKSFSVDTCGSNTLCIGTKKASDYQEKEQVEVDLIDESDVLKLLEWVQMYNKIDKSLLIITRGAMFDHDLKYAKIIGFVRVLGNEYTKVNIKMVDISKSVSKKDEKIWIQNIKKNFNDYEKEFCINNNEIYVPRLLYYDKEERVSVVKSKSNIDIYRLNVSPGFLETLEYVRIEKPVLNDNEVLVQVFAAPLNFKDVMLAMDLLGKEFGLKLGLEFSGKIIEKGKGVKKYDVGDDVFGFADNSLSSHVVASEDLIVKKPSNISYVDACSIAIVFITPYIALAKKAHIERGQNVLIHSAAGGVGQATIQLVKHFKCNPIATCSTEEKRNFLRKKYGVKIFGNSRSGNWDVEIQRQLPKGEGVDIVLNSLSKDHIQRGIKILRPFGSFIEIGKADILGNSHINLLPFLENLSYYSVHIDKMMEKRAGYVGKVLNEVKDLFAQNRLKPIVDKVFPSNEIQKAFRFMQSGKHRGKIVIDFNEKFKQKINLKPLIPNTFSPAKTYIVSGGMGGLGLEIIQWMGRENAKHIVILSRRGEEGISANQKRIISKLRENYGMNILISKTDVSNEKSVLNFYKRIKNSSVFPSRIGGILHLAMVLRDGMINIQTREMFLESFSAKVDGAMNLMKPLKPNDLDVVVFFSSISSVVGNIEQSAYCAANSFLDCYAYHLKDKGFNAKVINLGAVVDVGIIAESIKLRKILEMGLLDIKSGMKIKEVFDSIRTLFLDDRKNVQYIPELNLDKVIQKLPELAPKFSHLVKACSEMDKKGETNCSDVNLETVKKVIGGLLSISPERLSEKENLTEYGVDSLLAVEISNILKKKFSIDVSQMEILDGLNILQMLKIE